MDWILKHKLLSILFAVAVAFTAWYFLSGSSAPQPVLSTAANAQAPEGTQAMVQSLLSLQSVTLNDSLFSSPSFQALKDFTTPITSEPVGRNDPFAPVGASGGSAATDTNANTPAAGN
jgi:hypothetical protein